MKSGGRVGGVASRRLPLLMVLLLGLSIALPLQPAGVEFESAPANLGGDVWRLTWSSEPGVEYRLERSYNLQGWNEVDTITATGDSTSLDDAGLVENADRVFWRVVRLVPSDTEAPQVTIVSARLVDDSGSIEMELTAEATDNVAVVAVRFLEDGTTQLGAGTAAPDNRWTRIVPFGDGETPRAFQAEAEDAAGNVGVSGTSTYIPYAQLPPGIYPIDEEGNAIIDGLMIQRPDGSLVPFTWLPESNGEGAPDRSMQLVFPNGAQLVDLGGGEQGLAYEDFVAGFGPNSAIQFDTGLSDPTALFAGRGVNAAGSGTLPLGPLNMADLKTALGLGANDPIPLRLYNCFSLDLLDGELTERGIEGARWALGKLGLPLPEVVEDYVDGVFNLVSGEEATFPVYGTIELDDFSDSELVPELKIAKDNPLLLTLRANGEMALVGTGLLTWPNGTKLEVSVGLDDPVYRLSLRAEGLTVPLVDSFADFLPDNPDNCVPGAATPTDAQLEQGEACLTSFRVAYERFTLSALAARPVDAPDLGTTTTPSTFDTVSAIAEAWAASAVTPIAQSLPVQEVEDLIIQLGRAASGADDFKTAAEYYARIRELQVATQAYSDGIGSGDPNIANLQQSAADAANEALQAAILRSADDEAISSLDCLEKSLQLILEAETSRQLLGEPQSSAFLAAAQLLLDRYETRFLAALGVQQGETDPSQNEQLSGMNRFTLLEHVRTLLQVEATRQQLGLTGTGIATYELPVQVFKQAFAVVQADLDRAVAEGNPHGIRLGMADCLDIIAASELFGLSEPGLPVIASIQPYADALGTIVEREALVPRTESSILNNALRLRTMLRFLDEAVPRGLTLDTNAIRFAHGELEAALNRTLPLIDSESDPRELQEMLSGGIVATRVGRQFDGIANSIDWETNRLPSVVSRLATVLQSGLHWGLANDAVQILIAEAIALRGDAEALELANNLAAADERRASARIYQQQAALLLAAQRALAITIWNDTEAQRAADPDAFIADGLLPGDLEVDEIFGSVAFNRAIPQLSGAFGGKLRLPNFNASLTIENGSFSTGGAFELNAHGTLSLPGENPSVTMTVPKKDPFHFKWNRTTGIEIAGKGRFAFDNGIYFEAGLDFDDPLYTIEAEAGGLHVDLAETLASALPGNLSAADLADEEVARLSAEYWQLLTACIETQFASEAAAPSRPLGVLPEFAGNLASDIHCLADAWSCLIAAEAARGNDLTPYVGTFEEIGSFIRLLDSGFENGMSGFESIFGPDTEFEVAYRLARLEQISLSYRKIATALQEIAEATLTGEDPPIPTQDFEAQLNRAAARWLAVEAELSDNQSLQTNWELGGVLLKSGLELLAAYQVLGLTTPTDFGTAEVIAAAEEVATATAAALGLDATTGSPNAGVIATLDYQGAEDALRTVLDMAANLEALGSSLDLLYTPYFSALLTRQQEIANADLGGSGGQFFPDTVADIVAQQGIHRQLELQNNAAVLGISLPLPTALLGVLPDLMSRFGNRVSVTPLTQWRARKRILTTMIEIETLAQLGGSGGLLSGLFNQELLSTFIQMNAEARGRLAEDEVDLMRAVSGQLDNAPLASLYETRLATAAAAIQELLASPWDTGQIPLGQTLGEELIIIESLRRAHPAIDLPGGQLPSTLLTPLADRLIAICQTAGRATPLSQLGERFIEEVQIAPVSLWQDALAAEALKLLNASRTVSQGYEEFIANAGLDDLPLDFSLPDGLTIRRVYASVFYNRDTGFLKGTFGGRLEMQIDNEEAYFEIASATLDSNGAFALDGSTAFPIEPFDNANLRISSTIRVVGDTNGLTEFTGDADITLKISDDPNSGEQSFTGSVAYDGQAPGAPLAFNAAMDGVENLDAIRFSDDFVLFEGQLQAVFSTQTPGEFNFTIGGKAGFFSKEGALADGVAQEDFYSFFVINGLNLRYETEQLVAQFQGGSIHLDSALFKALEEELDGQGNPTGDLIPTGEPVELQTPENFAFCIGYNFATGAPIFTANEGSLTPVEFELPPLGFAVPGLEDSNMVVRTCTLVFEGSDFPVLGSLDASFTFPIPGIESPNPPEPNRLSLNVMGRNWRLDGFPDQASLALEADFRLLTLDGFALDLLGGSSEPGQETKLEFLGDPDLATPTLRFAAAMRGTVDGELLWDGENGEAVSFATGGTVEWEVGETPVLTIPSATISGNFNLGGENGLSIKGLQTGMTDDATLVLVNPLNIFQRSPSQPFELQIQGALDIANFIEFGLEQTSIIWDDQDFVDNGMGGLALAPRNPSNNLLPRFSTGGFYGALGEEAIELAEGVLPFYPTLIGISFKNSNLPLLPPQGQIGLLDPTNVVANLSGVLSLPVGGLEGGDTSIPSFSGSVDNLRIGFVVDQTTGLYVPDLSNLGINSLTMRLEGLDLPPIGGITGEIAVGNLDQLATNPLDIYFAGQVGGKVKEVGASVLLAVKPTEFLGACFELNAGPAGIPLDGGTLGGILLTGGRGGINFRNSFGDPCEFRTYIDSGSPVPAPEDRPGNPPEPPDTIITSDSGGPISCIEAPFPPPSRNPFYEEYPVDSGRLIYPGTRISESFLNNQLGITRATLQGLTYDQVVDQIVSGLATDVETRLGQAIADAVVVGTPPQAIDYFESLALDILNSFDDAATVFFREAFRIALNQNPDAELYDVLVAKLDEGIPGFDVTLKLEGTFSHLAISTVLTGTGGVTLSTTGTATLDGSINLIGIPVADGTFAFALTNESGVIEPAFGGLAQVALGPLELGELSMALSVSGFSDVVVNFAVLLECLADSSLQGAETFAYDMLDATFPDRTFSRSVELVTHFGALSSQEQTAYMGSFFNLFQIIADNALLPPGEQTALPVSVSIDDLADFRDCFIDFIVATVPEVEPFICFSGLVQPKVFGFPLAAETGASVQYGSSTENGVEYQELVAISRISPTSMMLGPVLGTLPGPLNNLVTSEMGYSVRFPLEEEQVELLLVNPGEFAVQQFEALVSDAVLSFGYTLQPLGLTLAEGQSRMILPRVSTHPENPNRTIPPPEGIEPVDWDPANRYGGLAFGSGLDQFLANEILAGRPAKLPTRSELILIALSKGQIKNPRWRGNHLDMVSLFEDPGLPADPEDPGAPGYTPSNATCDQLASEVIADILAADPTLEALSQRSFADDYFPHGGLIGGSEISFPNALANEVPAPQLVRLLTPPNLGDQNDVSAWLANAQRLFADPNSQDPSPGDPGFAYFTGTNCVGQMAIYLPAPNPVFPQIDGVQVDFSNATLEQMISSLEADFTSVINRSLPDELYPFDEILLTGWLDTQVMGMPVVRGTINYDNNARHFSLRANVVENTWLSQWVTGEVDFQIKSPQYMENTLSDEGSADLLAALGQQIQTLDPTNPTAVSNFIADVQQTMPKASLDAATSFQVPDDLVDFMSAGAGVRLFAYSAAYDPSHQPAEPSPRDVARRYGGLGLEGNFTFGYFPSTLPASQHIFIDVPDASLTFVPPQDPTLFPEFFGELKDVSVNLPNAFSFDGGPAQSFSLTDGNLTVNTNPDVGMDYYVVSGTFSPIDLGPFLQVTPRAPATDLSAELRITNAGNNVTTAALELGAADANIPLLGSLTGRIYGGTLDPTAVDSNDVFATINNLNDAQPFTFSTIPGEEWNAIVQLDGALEIRNPFNTSQVIFAAQPATQNNMQVPFLVGIEGEGLETMALRVVIPNGVTFTLFPGQPHESSFTSGSESATCLVIDTEGRIYFDSGTRTMNLAGNLAEVTGRLEFGYEPNSFIPNIAATTPPAFVTDLGQSVTQIVTVENTTSGGGQLVVDASTSTPDVFTVTPQRLILGGGETGELVVRYRPESPSGNSSLLRLTSNAANQPTLVIPLDGDVNAEPEMVLNPSLSINFSNVPLGTTRSEGISFTNRGPEDLEVTNISISGAAFSTTATELTVRPNATESILVDFTPESDGIQTGSLSFDTNDPNSPNNILFFQGVGSDRHWYRQRREDGQLALQDVEFGPNEDGYAAGSAGAYVDGASDGRVWRHDHLDSGPDLRDVAVVDGTDAWMVGQLGIGNDRTGHILQTTNGGASWIAMTSSAVNASQMSWSSACIIPTTNVLAAAGEHFGYGSIVTQSGATSFNKATFNTGVVPALHSISFGTSAIGMAVGVDRTIVATADGGKTWTRLTTVPGSVPSGTDFLAVAANPFDSANYVVVGENGLILSTTNTGTSWTVQTAPTSEDLHDILRAQTRFYAVGDGGTVLRGNSSGSSWSMETVPTTESLRGIGARNEGRSSVGLDVWAVSQSGGIYHRQSSAISGPIAVMNAPVPDYGEAGIGEQIIRNIWIANAGVGSFTASITPTSSAAAFFDVTPSGTQTLESGEETEFIVTAEWNGSGNYGTQLEINSSEDTLGKQDDFVFIDNRHPNFTPLGYLQMPTRIDLGTIEVGNNVQFTTSALNIGNATVELHGIDARYDSDAMRLEAEFARGEPVSVGKSETLRLEFEASAPGTYHGQIEVNSNAANGIATIDLVARVVAPPETVVITSDPIGVTFSVFKAGIGWRQYATPAVFAIVEDSPGEGELQRGTDARVFFPTGGTRGGLQYTFQRGEPAIEGRDFTFNVGESAPVMTAFYAVSPEAGPPVEDPPVHIALPCSLNPPGDVDQGPWVRVTDARLTIPWIGSPTSGTDFEVQGGLYMSLSQATGSLTSRRVWMRVPSDAPYFADEEVIEITPGAWSFDINSNGTARLGALTPGLQLFNRSTQPPSSLELEIDLNVAEGSRRGFFRFSTLDELPLSPAILALGPGSVELGIDLDPAAPDLYLTLDGSLRALAEPGDIDDWLIDLPFNLEFDPDVPSLGTTTYSTNTQLLELGVFRLHAQPGTTIGPTLNGSTFSFTATDLQIEFFRSGSRLDASLDFNTEGDFTISATLPSAGIDAGPFQLEPDSTTERDLIILGNPIRAELDVSLPPVELNSTANLWTDGSLTLPARTFSTNRFSVRLPLDLTELAGFDLTPQDDTDADNYIEFTRERSTASVRLRNERELYLGAYRLGFDLNTGGTLSGILAGRLGVETPIPLNEFSTIVSLSFDSRANPEFTSSRYFLNVPMRLKLGSSTASNGGVCTLKNGSPDPIEDWAEENCLP